MELTTKIKALPGQWHFVSVTCQWQQSLPNCFRATLSLYGIVLSKKCFAPFLWSDWSYHFYASLSMLYEYRSDVVAVAPILLLAFLLEGKQSPHWSIFILEWQPGCRLLHTSNREINRDIEWVALFDKMHCWKWSVRHGPRDPLDFEAKAKR